MAPQIIHLPDGQTFTVTPVFAGVGFKSHEMNTHPSAFPIGWTVVIHTEEEGADIARRHPGEDMLVDGHEEERAKPKKHVHSFRQPTLQNDTLFISSISNPSNNEFKPAASPTRQIAMMLWVTLYWYFHQPEPTPYLQTDASEKTPESAKPRGDWKINIKRDGVLRGRNLIPKLERMGLIASADTAVGTCMDDGGNSWAQMFVSRRMFWQIPGRLFLFTLQPNRSMSSFPGSPAGSRPGSPTRGYSHSPHLSTSQRLDDLPGGPVPTAIVTAPSFPIGPFSSTSHLPTYYPPAPLQHVFTNGVRHPLRPKPPRMGEVFYSRFVPSTGQYLAFRVASASPKPVPYLGPVGPKQPEHGHLCTLSDTSLLQMWLSNPRVQKFWGEYTPTFLDNALCSKHSFPVIGLWDGVPFGYFEIYWAKEDILGQHLGSDAGDWDRGLHMLVGEEWARGRVPAWLTGLVHWCFCGDFRTMNILMEPRVDNERHVSDPTTHERFLTEDRYLGRLESCGFSKVRQISLPHKQAWLVRRQRETWEGPVL